MFIRNKRLKTSTSVQIVKSIREGKVVRQHIVRHVGVVKNDDINYKINLDKLMIIAHKIKSDIELGDIKIIRNKMDDNDFMLKDIKYVKNSSSILVNNIRVVKHIVDGIEDVYGMIYRKIGFNSLFMTNKKYIKSADHLFNTVMARIYYPTSKLATSEILETDFAKEITVDQIYNMMDKITDNKISQIKKLAYKTTSDLVGGSDKIKVLFYDVTTIYFESFIEDDLKQYGYSKDMKFNQSQIMLSIIVTEDGLPIDYNLYPGSTFEGHTLRDSIIAIRDKYNISNVTIVADRGMLSNDNIDLLEKENINYIIASKLKMLKKDLKEQILDLDRYQEISDEVKIKEILLSPPKDKNKDKNKEESKNIKVKKRKLIVNYSQKRAKKDKLDREKAIERLQKKLRKSDNPKDLISNYGYKKYINITDGKNNKFTINYDKIENDAKWDGIHGIITNNINIDSMEAISQYKGLWQVEETFRLSKTNLKIRPIYHYTTPRIKAHIAISFMALICIRYAEYIIKARSAKISPAKITKILSKTTSTILQDTKTDKIFAIPNISNMAEHIYKLLEIPYRKKAYYPH